MLYIRPVLLLFRLLQQRQQPSGLPKYCLGLPWLRFVGSSILLNGELGIRLPTLVAVSLLIVIVRLRQQYQSIELKPESAR